MYINVDKEALQEKSKMLAEAANDFSVKTDNLQWELKLPSVEMRIMHQAHSDYKFKTSGLTEEEYRRYIDVANTYRSLEDFYAPYNLKETKLRIAMGDLKVEDLRFDPSLSIEEAYQKYSPVDRETGKKMSDFMYELDRKADLYEKDVREHYTGDLAAQLGYDKEQFQVQEKFSKESVDKFLKAMEKYTKKTPEQEQQIQQTLGDFKSFLDKTVENYEKGQNQEEGTGIQRK